MEALGFPPLVWYAFRHYFVSACAAAGYNIYDVAKWMGHANINVTYSTYMHRRDTRHGGARRSHRNGSSEAASDHRDVSGLMYGHRLWITLKVIN